MHEWKAFGMECQAWKELASEFQDTFPVLPRITAKDRNAMLRVRGAIFHAMLGTENVLEDQYPAAARMVLSIIHGDQADKSYPAARRVERLTDDEWAELRGKLATIRETAGQLMMRFATTTGANRSRVHRFQSVINACAKARAQLDDMMRREREASMIGK